MSKNTVYFDFAAATPVDKAVLKAMQPFWSEQFYNPSSDSLKSKEVKQALESARSSVAKILGARPSEVIFTAGGSEANNLALFGVTEQFKNGHMVTTAIEHDSILKPTKRLKENGFDVTFVKPDKQGLVDPQSIKRAIKDNTVLVSVMYTNNEVGTVQPIHKIAKVLQLERRKRSEKGIDLPLYIHSDAAQAPNYLSINTARLGVDLMTLNGGKIYGPKQSGILYKKAHVELTPQILGGGQEWGLRSGTENVPAAIGFGKALETATDLQKHETERLRKIQKSCIEQLKRLPNCVINGSINHRLPNNIHFTIQGIDNETLMYQLEENGFIVATGSACSASKDEPSEVLRAMGLSEADARSSLRLSFGRATSQNDTNSFISKLESLIQKK